MIGYFFGNAHYYRLRNLVYKLISSMQTQNQYWNASMVLKRVREIIDKNKAADLFHKAFLRPLEIALKTWRT